MKSWVLGKWQSLRALIARDPMLWAVFAVLWIITLVPIWGSRFLPLLDLPNHIDAIGIWHRYHDPTWRYSEYYDLQLPPVPYWGYFFPVHMMSYLFPIEVANKIYLSIYALALPVGCLLLAVRMGRSPWLAVLTWPLVFNMNFMFGFITCCAGLAELPYCIYALDLFLESPTRKRAVGLLIATTLLYFTHVLPWMYFGAAALVLSFCHGWHPRRILAAAGLMLPSLLIAFWGWHSSSQGNFTDIKAHGHIQFEAKWEKVQGLLQDVPNRLINAWQSDEKAYWFILVMASLWLLIVLSAREPMVEPRGERSEPSRSREPVASGLPVVEPRGERSEPSRSREPVASGLPVVDDPPRPGFKWRLELLFFLAVLAIFKLPIYQKKPVDLWMVGGRFVALAAMLGALLPRGPLTGKRKWLMVPVIAACIWYPLTLNKHWRRFDKRAAGIRKLMTLVPRGSSTLTLVVGDYNDLDADPQSVAFLQFHSYAQFYGGGYNPWALQTGFPMVAKKDKRLPAPVWKQPHSFRMDEHGIFYDYVLTYNEAANHALFGPSDAPRAHLVEKEGNWRLYKIVIPREP